MSIFGQVWVYSLVAFVLGVLLAWLFLVRPLRRRVRELERLGSMTDTSRSPGTGASRGSADAGSGTRTLRAGSAFDDDAGEIPPPSHTTYFQPDPRPAPEPGPAEVTQHITPHPSWPERDSLRDYRAAAGSPGSSASASQAAETGYYDAEPHKESGHYGNAGDLTGFSAVLDGTLDPEPQAGSDGTHAHEETRISPHRGGNLFEPVQHEDGGDEEPNASPADATMVTQPPAYAFGGPDAAGEQEEPEERTQILPKRQPRQALRGGFDAPQPIQPSLRPVARREPADEASGTQSGSLFEPAVTPPGPARAAQPAPAGMTPGPFGPGSALPRPDGSKPSDDFAVKASVTSLRYCTPDSPQFGDLVAEVWFRTETDAERVGFRPMS